MDKIFAIVVTWNGMRHDWLDKCLGSLHSSTVPVQTIVVDNGSTDGTVQYIRDNFPGVILITSEQNLGFGQANNRGLEKALELGGEYFFLLNQDAWIEQHCIAKLVLHLKNNPKYGILSPIHLNGAGDALDPFFATVTSSNKCPGLYSDFVLGKVRDDIYECDFVNAAAWLLSKECLRKVGGFSPAFYHYGEDDNYIHRLHYRNLKIGVYPKAFIYHDKENSKTDSADDLYRYQFNALTVDYSMPNRGCDFKVFFKYYRRLFYLQKFRGRSEEAKDIKSLLTHFTSEWKSIDEYRTQTMATDEYSFLGIKSGES